MKRRLLDIIRCPIDGSELDLAVFKSRTEKLDPGRCALVLGESADKSTTERLYGEEVLEGVLVSKKDGHLYPIIDGVPRLIADAASVYSDFFARHSAAASTGQNASRLSDERSPESFGRQWSNYQFEDRTWFKDLKLREREFLYSMALTEEALPGRVLLDAGCGHGALTAAITGAYAVETVGLDFTDAVGRAQASREKFAGGYAPFVHYVQGDLLQPPLAPAVFDFVHSSGVIHHTPDPRRAFRSLFDATRPDGRVYVQVYRKREAWVGIPNILIRSVTTRIPTRLLWALCVCGVPVHTALVHVVAALRGERPMLAKCTRRERALSLFDNYSPRYQFRYRPEEIRRFFTDMGIEEVHDTTLANEARHMVAFVGVKTATRTVELEPKPVKADAAEAEVAAGAPAVA
ncbi:MAG TPA: methyltransferase domain-containing protein [Gammaproteobacteria bacterium]|jgi:SAM-dependent methyltransferase|nr:methyltransferase domain-containing protein [Gammaproteobacteria bacterium]